MLENLCVSSAHLVISTTDLVVELFQSFEYVLHNHSYFVLMKCLFTYSHAEDVFLFALNLSEVIVYYFDTYFIRS